MAEPLKLGVLTGRTVYPVGMAATERIHLVARAMAEAGARVRVWVDGLERWPDWRNHRPAGERDGIPYECLLGKTRESRLLPRLVYDRFAMALAARRTLAAAARGGSLDTLYFYTSAVKLDFERFVVRGQARRHGFPVVIDLCEAPWTLRPEVRLPERWMSPLWGVDGAVCISRLLEDWVEEENARTGRAVRLLPVPILVDAGAIEPATAPPRGKSVLFAGSRSYGATLRFLLAAMERVWLRHPDCRLVVTGGATETTPDAAPSQSVGRIRWAGYLERGALLREYTAASVLVVPLFDDVCSRARFPTKIAEYLAAGRPVVTNRVGEIPRFLEDGVDVLAPPPGDTAAFAAAIGRLLDDPGFAQAVGRAGRRAAERHFHYANHGARLCEFFSSLAHKPPPLLHKPHFNHGKPRNITHATKHTNNVLAPSG